MDTTTPEPGLDPRFSSRCPRRALEAAAVLAAASLLIGAVAIVGRADAQSADPPSTVAFTDVTSDGLQKELFVVQPDGTTRIQLTASGSVHESQPSWSPDQGAIAYSANLPPDPIQGDDLVGVQVIDIATRITRTIAPGPADSAPAWHPDGSLIAFASAFGMGTEAQVSAVSVVEPTGDNPRPLIQLVDQFRFIDGPAWSPDGSRVAFVVGSGALGGQLYVVNADGSDARSLGLYPGRDNIEPAWSPDGASLAFASAPNTGQGARSGYEIAVLDLDSGASGSIAAHPERDLRGPSWSPDGNQVMFGVASAIGGGASELWAVFLHDRDWRGPITLGAEPDWAGVGAEPPASPTPASPTTEPTAGSPTVTAEATSTIPPAPSMPPPATLPPFPTFAPPKPSGTPGPLPTYPLPTATATASPTGGPTHGPMPLVVFLPYAANNHAVEEPTIVTPTVVSSH